MRCVFQHLPEVYLNDAASGIGELHNRLQSLQSQKHGFGEHRFAELLFSGKAPGGNAQSRKSDFVGSPPVAYTLSGKQHSCCKTPRHLATGMLACIPYGRYRLTATKELIAPSVSIRKK